MTVNNHEPRNGRYLASCYIKRSFSDATTLNKLKMHPQNIMG